MSKKNLVKLVQAAAGDEQLQQRLQNADSYETVKSLAAERGFELGNLSKEEAVRIVDVLTGAASGELSDEELELVAGGYANIEVNYSKGIKELSSARTDGGR